MEIDDLIQLAKTRRSIRRFKPDPVPDEHITKILEVARWAMSGANGQPWEFVVVKDPELRKKLVEIAHEHQKLTHEIEMTRIPELRHPGAAQAPTQPGWRDAPVVIVVAGDPRTFMATVLATHFLSGEWATFYKNLANATQFIHLAAATLGLGGTWVSINRDNEWRIKVLLGIPDIFRIYTIIPLGYPAYKPAPSYRRELKEIVHFNKYDQSRYRSMTQVIEFIATLRKRTRPTYEPEGRAKA